MKFTLAYMLCSAITGFCNNTVTHPQKFNTWTDCVNGGAEITIETVNHFKEKFEDEKLYISYFCTKVEGEDA